MKVTICTGDRSAVGIYRLHQPVRVLQEKESGLEIEVVDKIPLMADPDTSRILSFGRMDCDVFVMQLPMYAWVPDAIPALQAQGVKVVIEVDDDFQSMNANHQSFWLVNPRTSPHRNWRHLRAACAQANLVTCSSAALARIYAGHGRVAVLRNYVSQSLLDIPNRGDGRTVGWSGGLGVHPGDLEVTRGGVAQAVRETDARFLHAGSRTEEVGKLLGLDQTPESTGWVDFELYPTLLARMDVGIIPLADTRFNESKSWIKGLEMAAVGVPFVASDVAEYQALKKYGLGALAKPRSKDWRREIKRLLEEPQHRHELAELGRLVIKEDLNIEDNAWRWAEAWESVCRQPKEALA